ncbi:MAG: hypothetical protein ABI972_04670 [Acidobacteriota bacterium]
MARKEGLMATCWAKCLGNCSTKGSREHIVSKALFLGDSIQVQGFAWCKEKPKAVGLASLTAKILCEYHNNSLSPVDVAGAQAFDALRKIRTLENTRDKLKPQIWNIKRFTLQGAPLERWFLKTLINLSFGSAYPIGRRSVEPGEPSCDLVETALGLRQFEGKAGLYSVVRTGMSCNSTDRVGFTPLIKDLHHIEGGIFIFRGLMFLLSLEPDGPPQPLTGIHFDGEHIGDCQLNFHNRVINVKNRKYLSQVLTTVWD